MTSPINNPTNSCNSFTSSDVVQQNFPLSDLPIELVIEILTRLNGADIRDCRLICKQGNQILSREDVWRSLFEKHFPHINSTKIKNFQEAYKLFYSNLTNGICTSNNLKRYYGGIRSIVTFDGGFISGSGNGEISIWDLKTLARRATLKGHTGVVKSLAIFNGRLISGSYDKTIKIWDLEKYTCIATLEGHTDWVTSLAISNGMLISGFGDNTIKIWDLNTHPPTYTTTFEGDRDQVGSLVIFDDGRLISVCCNERYQNDSTIKIWDLSTNPPTCKATLEGHTYSVTSLLIFDGRLISGFGDNTIKIWDLKKLTCIATLEGHRDNIASLAIFNGMLVSGGCFGTIKIWDLKTLICTATLKEEDDCGVDSLAVSNGKLISGSGSGNGTSTVWDFMANNDEVFKEIAGLFASDNPYLTRQAPERFLRMPKSAKDKIYGELYKIIEHRLTNNYWGCAEHAFHDQYEQSSTHLEKAEAIRNYLATKKELEQFTELLKEPFFKHLGIVTLEQFKKILHCRPEHLEKIGIASSEDLQLICSFSLDVQALVLEKDSGVKENFRDKEVKLKADKRKMALSGLSQQMSQIVASKIQETNVCDSIPNVLLYPGECPWVGFQNKLDAFRAKFDAIVLGCNGSPQLTVETFNSAKYNELATELNALVEEFQALDRNHQIAKLRTYIHQWGILPAWNKRRAVGVQKLVNLPAPQTLQSLLQMGLLEE
jgi:WD40 repeat protein